MAYENYSFVSWSEGTPITSLRLHQMSTNTHQVKLATDSLPKGVLKFKQIASGDSPSTATVNANIQGNYEVIALKNEGGGVDNRITLENGRRYRITVSFPGVKVATAGGEDSIYHLAIKRGTITTPGNVIANVYLESYPGLYVNVASTAVSNVTVTSGGNTIVSANNITPNTDIRFGAGTYSYVFSGAGEVNESFFVEIKKTAGSSGANRITTYSIAASETPIQFYIEDVGAV